MHYLNYVVVDADKKTWNVSMAVHGDDFFLDVVRSVFEQLTHLPVMCFQHLRYTIYQYSQTVGSYIGFLPVIEFAKQNENVPIAVKFDERNTYVVRLTQI